MKAEARSTNAGPEQAEAFSLANRGTQPLDGEWILGAHVDVALGRAHGIGGNEHAFEHAVGIAFEHTSGHESPGIAVVRSVDNVFLPACPLGTRSLLEPGGI